jgi:hypothetical protein
MMPSPVVPQSLQNRKPVYLQDGIENNRLQNKTALFQAGKGLFSNCHSLTSSEAHHIHTYKGL